MAVSAKLVKELREETGSGMMDCKKALVATNGDKEAAIEWLRKNGLAKAEKKAGRIAAEGVSMIVESDDAKKAVVVEVNSETDFVATNEKFRDYVHTVAEQALTTDAADVDALMAETSKADPTKTVAEYHAGIVSVIGENLKIRRFTRCEEQNGFVAGYTHMNGKIAVLVDVESDVVSDEVREMGKNIAMQIAALNPKYTSDAEVPEDYKEHEKSILTEQVKNDPKMAGKPDKIIAGAVMGRLKKELKEVCLLDQVYVKAEDGKQSVAQYVASVAKAQGAKINVKGFVRYETGEGLEKKSEDFAAEVAAQLGK